jgi:hypothetical protein
LIFLDLNERLESIEKLIIKSKSASSLDDSIYWIIKKHKRKFLYDQVDNHVTALHQNALKFSCFSGIPLEMVLVESSLKGLPDPKSIGSRDMCEDYFQSIQSDMIEISSLQMYGKEALEKFDSKERRVLYLSEFKERSRILLEFIKDGKLDYFTASPYKIVHEIMGRHGRLLPHLEIDTKNSETVRRFVEEYKLRGPPEK